MKKYTAFFLLLLFLGCTGEESPVQSDTEPLEPVPAVPVDIAPPEVLFTEADRIKEGKRSTVIMDRLIKLIDAVPEDGTIYISIYMFEYEPLLKSLERAHSRNVSLHVMMNMSDRSDNTATANRLTVLNENVEVVRIYNNASGSAINHNKFVLIPEVTTIEGVSKNVIFQTSQNFKGSGNRKLQDAVILSDEGLYEAYLEYWLDMKSLANVQMDRFRYREYEGTESGITAYFLPKRKNGRAFGEDTIIELLDGIDDPSSATVKVGMSAWTDSRSVILSKLEELVLGGAKVEVVTKNNIGAEVQAGLENLAENGALVKIYNITNSDQQRINIHSKLMMISGIWKGKRTKLLVTGTQNFTMNALRNNNEVTLLFRDHEFFNQYTDYYEELKSLPGICCD